MKCNVICVLLLFIYLGRRQSVLSIGSALFKRVANRENKKLGRDFWFMST